MANCVQKFHRHMAALPLAYWLLLTVGGFTALAIYADNLALAWCYALALTAATYVGKLRKFCLPCLVAVLISALAVALANHRGKAHYENFLSGRDGAGIFTVRLTDPGLTVELPPVTGTLLQAELLSIQLNGTTAPVTSQGAVLVRLPGYGDTWRYGDGLKLEGTLSFGTDDTFGRYLDSRQICGVLNGEQLLERLPRQAGLIGRLLDWRDVWLRLTIAPLTTERNRSLAAALFFGVRLNLAATDRQKLLAAGTMHLFAVSGMHVALLAGMCLLLLRFLSLKPRYLAVAGLIVVYVLSTGANPPAVRAMLMLDTLLVLRAFGFWTPGLRLVSLAAVVLLWLNPYNLYNIGFFYSLIITAVLCLLAVWYQDLTPLGRIDRRYLARKLPYRYYRTLPRKIAMALASCLMAFLGGSALSMAFFRLFLPGSVVTNFLLLPLVAVFFPIWFAELLLGWIPGAGKLFGWLLDLVFSGFYWAVDLGGAVFASTQFQGLTIVGVVVFYLSFWVLLAAKNRYAKLGGALVAAGILLAQHGLFGVAPPQILAIKTTNAVTPAVLLVEPAASYALLVDVPSGSAPLLEQKLRQLGLGHIDMVIFSSGVKAQAAGVGALARRVALKRKLTWDFGTASPVFRNCYESLPIPEERPRFNIASETGFNGGLWQILPEKTAWRLVYFNPASKISIDIECTDTAVTVKTPSGTASWTVPYSNQVESFSYVY